MCQNCHSRKKCTKSVKKDPIVGWYRFKSTIANPIGDDIIDFGQILFQADGNLAGDSLVQLQVKTTPNPLDIGGSGSRATSFVGRWKRIGCTRQYTFLDGFYNAIPDLCATGLCGDVIVPSGAADPGFYIVTDYILELSEDGTQLTQVGIGTTTLYAPSDLAQTNPLLQFNISLGPILRVPLDF